MQTRSIILISALAAFALASIDPKHTVQQVSARVPAIAKSGKVSSVAKTSVECGDTIEGTISSDIGPTYSLSLDAGQFVTVYTCSDSFLDGIGVFFNIDSLSDSLDLLLSFDLTHCDGTPAYVSSTFLEAGDHDVVVVQALGTGSKSFSFQLSCYALGADTQDIESDALACGSTADGDASTSDDYILGDYNDVTYAITIKDDSKVEVIACSMITPFVSIYSVSDDTIVPKLWSTELLVDENGDCTGTAGSGSKLSGKISKGDYYLTVEGTNGDDTFTLDITCSSASGVSVMLGMFASLMMAMRALF